MEFVIVSFSCPIMKIVNIHDINSNKDVPLNFARYDNSSIGNVQVPHEGGELGAFTIQQAKKVVGAQRKTIKNRINICVFSFKTMIIKAKYIFFIDMNVKGFKLKIHDEIPSLSFDLDTLKVNTYGVK
jgi:hypothetical protein